MQGLGRGWDLYNGEQIQRLQESCRHTGIPGCSCRLHWTLTGTVVLWALWRKGQRKRSWKENCFQECSDIINKGYLEITISPLSKSLSTSSFFFKVYKEHVVDLWLIACLLWTDAFSFSVFSWLLILVLFRIHTLHLSSWCQFSSS